MAPHAPFSHTHSIYSPAPLHPRSFEPFLSTKAALLKVDIGPTPTSTLEAASSPNPTLRVPYIGIGPVELTGSPNFALATSTPSATAGLYQATQKRHDAAIIAVATLAILWFIGFSTLCYFQFCRRKNPTSKDRESDPRVPDFNLLRDHIRSKNSSIPPGAGDLKAADYAEKSANSADFSVETLNDKQGHPPAPVDNCILLPLSDGGAGPPSPTPSLGDTTISEGNSAPTTPTCQQDGFYGVPLTSERTPSPLSGNARFTWDFKCAGGISGGQNVEEQAVEAKKGARFPFLPPLMFNNPLGELMRLLGGSSSPPPQQTPGLVKDSVDSNNQAQAPTASSTENISASSTWTAISIAESQSLEEFIEHASGQPLVTIPLPNAPPSASALPLAPRVEDGDMTMVSEADQSPQALTVSQTPIDEEKSNFALSEPNHRALTPSTPALKQLLSAAGLSVSPSPTALPNLPRSSLSLRSSSSFSSTYSSAGIGSRSSLTSPTSSDSAASSFLGKFPAVPLLNDRLASLSRGSGPGQKSSKQHHRMMSDASMTGKAGKTAETMAGMRASLSVPACIDLAHWSGRAGKIATVKLKFD